jgi:outer membrane protein TolC
MAPAELLVPRAGYAAALLAMARSDELYSRSKRQLCRLAGVESINEDTIPLEAPKWNAAPNSPAVLMARAVRDGVEGTFQGQINALRIKDAELNYKIARTRLYPKFSLSASASQYNSQNVTSTSVNQQAAFSTTYGVSGSWTLFDGFAARGAKLYALANKRAYEQQQKSLNAQISDQVESSVQLIGFTVQALEMTETNRTGVALTVERVSDEYKRGTVTEDAVTSATSLLYGQEAAVVAGRVELLSRWCDLVSLVGVDPILNQLPARYVQ